ncbi:hypothetical protein [Halopelagius fulvigenes]|uniref:Uncharacterized protein n=1 Tax=Halopelagius fulvigenes TaxID=1198324 RepID=A0ABD5TSC4_9EURY
MTDYRTVVAPAVFTVLTVTPFADEPEYREYEVGSDDLPLFLESMADEQHAERVVTVERGEREDEQ